MGIRLTKLQSETATTTLTWAGEEASITYRPNVITPRMVGEMQQAEDADQQVLIDQLKLMLVSWDVVDDDDQPLPITDEVLMEMPVNFLVAVIQKVQTQMVPDPKESGSFGAG